jgi:hypothetical protein
MTSPESQDRRIAQLRVALLGAIDQARVLNSILYGGKIHLRDLPKDPTAALAVVDRFRSQLREVAEPLEELSRELSKALEQRLRSQHL